jgi:DNA-directed RNA polymerase subunit RPC12/RpoP
MSRNWDINQDFKCAHCGHLILTHPLLAGVNNRNHCPHCLWSRHMDLWEAGDRLSACKAPMQPIGLTLKRRHKKYPGAGGGELMLVHLCTACKRVSINRIAADDDAESLLAVYQGAIDSPPPIAPALSTQEITLLDRAHLNQVTRQLYGRQPRPEPVC